MSTPVDGRSPAAERFTAAVYANSFRTVHPAIGATGLRTYEFQHDSLADPAVTRSAEEFLLDSRLVRGDLDFNLSVGAFFATGASEVAEMIDRSAEPSLPLPEIAHLGMRLHSAIARRRSVRRYSGDPMPLDQLAAVLWSSAGVTGRSDQAQNSEPIGRATASGGALYPVSIWIATLRVRDLPEGVYSYDPHAHGLVVRGGNDMVSAIRDSVATPDEMIMVSRSCVLALLIARPWRSMRKYGPRGMRHVFVEAGAMSAHLHLACAALGFGSVDCSSVYDDEIHHALGIDGVYETLVHACVVGAP